MEHWVIAQGITENGLFYGLEIYEGMQEEQLEYLSEEASCLYPASDGKKSIELVNGIEIII